MEEKKKAFNCRSVVQSYGSTLMCYQYSTYEQRLMMKIAELCQPAIEGTQYSEHMLTPYCTDGININMAVSVIDIVGKNTHNKQPLKDSLLNMQKNWVVQYYDKPAKVWRAAPVIYNLSLEERTGIIKFSCARWLIDYICDFRQGGFRKYNIAGALSLRSPYHARLYQLVSSLSNDISYNIEYLKKVLGVGDKFKRNTDFVRRCIAPAAKALENAGLNGFDYKLGRSENAKKKGADIITLVPIKREAQNIATVPIVGNERVKSLLITNCRMTQKEIASHIDDINAFACLPDCVQKLAEIINRAAKRRKNKGYVFAAIKAVLRCGR
jgi:hypothetical protein